MTYPVPMVRLTIEGMTHEIVKALNVHADEMRDRIEEEVKLAVEGFDWTGEVGRLARYAISETIKREVDDFFGRNGPGGHLIRDAIAKKLDKDGSWNV